MPQAIITVSIVTFRTDISLLHEVLGALMQCSMPLEILIVDHTPEPEYFVTLQALKHVRCIRSPRNGGYGYGHNIALHASTPTPYYLVLNPDVLIHAGCIETLIKEMEAQQDIVLAVPKTLNDDGTLQPLNKRNPTVLDLILRRLPATFRHHVPSLNNRINRYMMMDIGYDASYEVEFASGCFMLFRRSALDTLRGFDERFFMYFEDADITRRARALGRVQFFPHAVITHKWSGGSRTSWRLSCAIVKSAFQYFDKWGWRGW